MTDTNANVPKVRTVPPTNSKSAVMPTEGSARRDAIGALVDDVTSTTVQQTTGLLSAANALQAVIIEHAAKLKLELEQFVRDAEASGAHAKEITEHVERMRAEHAKLVK